MSTMKTEQVLSDLRRVDDTMGLLLRIRDKLGLSDKPICSQLFQEFHSLRFTIRYAADTLERSNNARIGRKKSRKQ